MSAYSQKRTLTYHLRMSAVGGRADMEGGGDIEAPHRRSGTPSAYVFAGSKLVQKDSKTGRLCRRVLQDLELAHRAVRSRMRGQTMRLRPFKRVYPVAVFRPLGVETQKRAIIAFYRHLSANSD